MLLVRRLALTGFSPGYLNFSVTTLFPVPLRCWYSMMMWMMITRMMLIMKKRSQMSASFKLDDFGKVLMIEERREANTRNPVIAPMNLLSKSLTSMKSVKQTRNQRTKVWRKEDMKIEIQILSSLIVNWKLLPFGVTIATAERSVTQNSDNILCPFMIIGFSDAFKATVKLFFHGSPIIPTHFCLSNGY